jgi:uncharacterized protein (UPF0332 family)
MSSEPASLAKHRLGRARQALDDAQVMLARGSLNAAVNRAYYCMFYAAQALLGVRGIASPRHSGTISLLDKEFVNAGAVSKEASQMLHRAFEQKTLADYKDFYTASREDAESLIADGQAFAKEIRRVIRGMVSEGSYEEFEPGEGD